MKNKPQTIVTRMTLNSKSLLARLLATENIVVEHDPASDTAYFDTASRRLVLPVWDNMDEDTYDMLVGHEVGHALFTPVGAEQLIDAINSIDSSNPNVVKGFLNVVEDARIERLMKRRYAGLAHNFRRAYTRMYENDQFGFRSRTQKPQDLTLIDRLNLRAKIGVHATVDIPLDAAEELVFGEMMRTESWDEVVALTKRIYDMHQQQLDNTPTPVNPTASGNTLMDGTPSGGAPVDDDSGAQPSQVVDTEVKTKPTAPITDQAQNRMGQSSKNPDEKQHITYVELPASFDTRQVINPYSKIIADFAKVNYGVEYAKWRDESKRYVSMMSKEFELRKAADTHARTNIARSGVIDTDRLHQYKYVEDIFRRNATVRDGKNHGMIMLLDWSSSMAGVIGATIRQTMLLAMFCRQANIPFEVLAFSDATSPLYDRHDKRNNINKREINFGRFKFHQFLSNQMSTTDYNRMMEILLAMSECRAQLVGEYVLNSTPLYNAIAANRFIADEFRKRNNLQIVNTVILTDGDDSNGLDNNAGQTIVAGYGRAVLRDRATGAQVALHEDDGYRGRLGKMIQFLKYTTDSNVVGFYLVNSTSGRNQVTSLAGVQYGSDEVDALMSRFRTEKFLQVSKPEYGYDAFFILPSDKMEMELDERHDYLNKTLTKGRIATAFLKTSQARAVNRVLIRRFVDFISRESEKI